MNSPSIKEDNFQGIIGSRLARKQLVIILLISSIATLVGTLIQLLLEYQSDVKYVDAQLAQIDTIHLESLTSSLWSLDNKQINIQLQNIIGLRDIVHLEIKENGTVIFSTGSSIPKYTIMRTHPMIYRAKGIDRQIGVLHAYASFSGVYQRMIQRIVVILLTQGLKTFVVSFSILFVIHRIVIRHLVKISLHARELRLYRLNEKLVINRKQSANPDELDTLVAAFNTMRRQLESDLAIIKASELALKKSEKEFRDLYENAPNAYFSINLDGRIKQCNQRAGELLGYEVADLIGRNAVDLYANGPFGKEKAACLFNRFRKGEVIHDEELQMKTADGTAIWVSLTVNAIKDEQGRIVESRSMGVDISDRKHAEKALKHSEEKYRSMMEAMMDAAYICSPDFRIEYMNPRMIEMVGHDATGETCHEAIFRIGAPCSWCLLEKIQSGKHTEFELTHPQNKRSYLVSNSPVPRPNGKHSKLTIYRDITKRKEIEARLLQWQKMESIGNLAGGIAHDFNNLLTPIIGMSELLLEDLPQDSLDHENVRVILKAGKRGRDLVKQILAFAKQSDEERKPIQPGLIAREVLRLMRSTIPTTIEIKQHIESISLIMGNATQLHQVLMNLCTNAAQAMEDDGGTLALSISNIAADRIVGIDRLDFPSEDYIEIKVSDTGIGIAPDKINSIFEPYFTTKGPGEGTGMGLALVHGVVKAYGGQIIVNSKDGQGTTFSVYLPVTQKHSREYAYQQEELLLGSERILFVDDEYPIAKMGSKILERLGYSVTTKTSSMEALALFQAKPYDFDLIVTDMTMPKMTGDKLAIGLMKIRPDIPVILCTGYSNKISNEGALKMGIKAFALKPLVKADLAKTVRKVIDETKSEKQE